MQDELTSFLVFTSFFLENSHAGELLVVLFRLFSFTLQLVSELSKTIAWRSVEFQHETVKVGSQGRRRSLSETCSSENSFCSCSSQFGFWVPVWDRIPARHFGSWQSRKLSRSVREKREVKSEDTKRPRTMGLGYLSWAPHHNTAKLSLRRVDKVGLEQIWYSETSKKPPGKQNLGLDFLESR